mgnify:CR=1 FL=1
MKQAFFPRAETVLDGIYVDLVRSLYAAFIPSVIMSVGFVAGGVLMVRETGDMALALIVAAGTLASLIRLAVAFGDRKEALDPGLGVERAQRLEHRFAATYLAFAVCLGAFGARGPLSRRPGYDPLMQAFGGIMSVTGNDGEAPVRVGVSIIDQGAGMWAAIGILAALQRRALTGEGCTARFGEIRYAAEAIADLRSGV